MRRTDGVSTQARRHKDTKTNTYVFFVPSCLRAFVLEAVGPC